MSGGVSEVSGQGSAAHVLASLAPSPLPCAILYASPTLRALLRELTCCSLIHRRRLHHSLRERVDVARRIERSTCARYAFQRDLANSLVC